jgi:hypothetical protein
MAQDMARTWLRDKKPFLRQKEDKNSGRRRPAASWAWANHDGRERDIHELGERHHELV